MRPDVKVRTHPFGLLLPNGSLSAAMDSSRVDAVLAARSVKIAFGRISAPLFPLRRSYPRRPTGQLMRFADALKRVSNSFLPQPIGRFFRAARIVTPLSVHDKAILVHAGRKRNRRLPNAVFSLIQQPAIGHPSVEISRQINRPRTRRGQLKHLALLSALFTAIFILLCLHLFRPHSMSMIYCPHKRQNKCHLYI